MDKNQIRSRLLQSLDLELTLSGFKDDTDLDFQNYIIKKFRVPYTGYFPKKCFECGKPIGLEIPTLFVLKLGNHNNNVKENIYLDGQCLFKEYILPIIIERWRNNSKKEF